MALSKRLTAVATRNPQSVTRNMIRIHSRCIVVYPFHDIVVLVAPFSTINWAIRHIPIIGKIMGGTLISIPVRVSGHLADPDVVFLSPTAVGSRVLNLLKNIVNVPVDIISPILPKEKGEEQKE